MNAKKDSRPAGEAMAPPTGRLWAGVIVFALGWIIGFALLPFVTGSDFPTSVKATLSTICIVVVPKVFLIGAIAILGKPGFNYLKGVVFAFVKKVGPPAEVGPWRYNIGLLMFFLPFVTSLFFSYFEPIFEGGEDARPKFEKISDFVQIAALFVLGGDFWDKLRALFVRKAKAVFPPKEAKAAS